MWQQEGFVKGSTDINDAMKRLTDYIESLPLKLNMFSDNQITEKPAAGKWSKKEIVGHLVDSAINNLERFTEIQFLPQPYVVTTYNQDELVKANHYQALPLDQLLQLWQTLNRQIVFVVKNIPSEKLQYPVDPKYENGEMKNLGWLICDYVAHMEHHFRQIFPVKQKL